jgi:ribosome biogenesis GTPase / thiamine phosphate phosphatase
MDSTNDLSLAALGWREYFADAFGLLDDDRLSPARIVIEHRGAYVAFGDRTSLEARITGRFRHLADDARDLPAVGDWVALRAPKLPEDPAVVQALLPRRTSFVRGSAGHELEPQVVAANVDRVLITSSMDADCNPRRLERYLALVHESGAEAVIVLTKSDLVDDPAPYLATTQAIASHVPTFVVSNETNEGVSTLRESFGPAETVALVGSSGVGKSSLVNQFLGFERQAVADTRDDGKGRHTTIRRELIALPGGGLLLDTPGMRELQLWDGLAGLLEAFPEIEELTGSCRFSDCTHRHEPGCAVKAALGTTITEERLQSFLLLSSELDEAAEALRQRSWKRRS